MSVKNTFVEITNQMAKKQSVMVDSLTVETPILSGMPMQPASHGLFNLYEEVDAITGGDMIDLDAALPTVEMKSKLKQIDLSIIGGIMKVGEDKARRFGGPAEYFANKMPSVLRQTGMNIEASLIYNNLRAYAYANDKLISANGEEDVNYSLLVVTWVPGEITGLYDEEGFGAGKVFDIIPLNGGEPYEDPETPGRIIYAQRLKTYFGIQLANPAYVSGIVNIDLQIDDIETKDYYAMPTEVMINDCLAEARAMPGSSFIYCHNRVAKALGKYKGTHLEIRNGDVDLSYTLRSWDGIPIITSYNFLDGTETDVTI